MTVSDLTRVSALLAPPASPAARKPRSHRKPKSNAPALPDPLAPPDPIMNPQPGDRVSANGRTRHVQKIEFGHVLYTLGEADSRVHAVNLAGWRSWGKEYGRVEQ